MNLKRITLLLAVISVFLLFPSCSSSEGNPKPDKSSHEESSEPDIPSYQENYVTLLNTIRNLAGEEGIQYTDTINGKIPAYIEYGFFRKDRPERTNRGFNLGFVIPASSESISYNSYEQKSSIKYHTWMEGSSSLVSGYFPKNNFYKYKNGDTYDVSLYVYMSYDASSRIAHFYMNLNGVDSNKKMSSNEINQWLHHVAFLEVTAECDASTLTSFDDIHLSKSGNSMFLGYSDSEIGEIVKLIFSDLLVEFNEDIQGICDMTIKDIGFEKYEF